MVVPGSRVYDLQTVISSCFLSAFLSACKPEPVQTIAHILVNGFERDYLGDKRFSDFSDSNRAHISDTDRLKPICFRICIEPKCLSTGLLKANVRRWCRRFRNAYGFEWTQRCRSTCSRLEKVMYYGCFKGRAKTSWVYLSIPNRDR